MKGWRVSESALFLSSPYTGLAGVLVLGIMSQWLAWRFRLPSILLLLVLGMLAGQVGFLDPDRLFGDLLRPMVSFSVAIILFEGSLSLKFKDLATSGPAIRNLMSIGVLVTWALTTLACRFILDIGLSKSLLISAILTVTGPTVIMPMLRFIRPSGDAAKILKWEGIVNDPIGSVLALLVFEAVLTLQSSGIQATFWLVTINLVKTFVVGGLLGFIVSQLFIFILRRDWIPVYLQSPITLMVLLATFVLSNFFQKDSGLLTVTLMGIIFANQKRLSLDHIIEFKENLGLILLSSLFILLAARLQFNDLLVLGWQGVVFLVVLIVIIRPATVFLSTWNTKLKLNEKLFLAFMAPRGIVAAAISSVFALRLDEAGFQNGRIVAQVVFLAIMGTVVFHSLTALPIARYLKLAGKAKGVLILGAHTWAQQLAEVLTNLDIPVILVDRNAHKISTAKLKGLPGYMGNILSERTLEDLDLTDFGQLLALLPSAETNSLATLRFQKILGPEGVYQLYSEHKDSNALSSKHELPEYLQGKVLFGKQYTYEALDKMLETQYQIKTTGITPEFDMDALRKNYKNNVVPLALVTEAGELQFATDKNSLTPKAGQKLIFIAPIPSETALA